MEEIYNNIPTWDNGKWTITDFESRELFSNFIFGAEFFAGRSGVSA